MGKHVHTNAGMNAARTGREHIAFTAEAYPRSAVEIVAIIVEQTGAADAQWNVEFDGENAITSEQQVNDADVPQTFIPNESRNRLITSNECAAIALDRSSASATNTSELHVTVLTDDHRVPAAA